MSSILVHAAVHSGEAFARDDDGSSSSLVRQQLVSFLSSGADTGVIPESNMLYPAVRFPLLATTAWVLMHDDPASLEKVYPRLSEIVMQRFDAESTTPEGLVPGGGGTSAYALPSVNALACLELHSLSMAAMAAGRPEECIELRDWAEKFTSFIVRTFYDTSHDCFYPVTGEGHFIVSHSPSFLLPMVVDRSLSPPVRKRISDRLLYNMENMRGLNREEPLWNGAATRPVVEGLLECVKGFPAARLETLAGSPGHDAAASPAGGALDPWSAVWKGAGASELLFPPWEGISSLLCFREIARREDILDEKIMPLFEQEVDSVLEAVTSPASTLAGHISGMQRVNRLLVRISGISEVLEKGDRIWKVLDDDKFRTLSPRTRKMFALAASSAVEELNSIKSDMTSSFMESAGIVASVNLPDMSVPIGSRVDIELSVSSSRVPLDLSQVFLQAGSNRWQLSQPEQSFRTGPGLPAVEWTRSLMIPPAATPGIVDFPVLVDMMTGQGRLELHLDECMTVTTGYEVSLDMPSGKLLPGKGSLPLNLSLRYTAGGDVRGQVDGVFIDGITTDPPLPARFAVTGGREITRLPLEVIGMPAPVPGRYPFSLTVSLDGRTIASFENDLYVPLEWLHVGPVSSRRWALEDGVHLQDNLATTYRTPEGKQLGWEPVAEGAYGPSGEVMPGHLYGSGADRGMLLFTMVEVPEEKRVYWTLETASTVSLWINSAPVLESDAGEDVRRGAVILRKGRNSILVASCWTDSPENLAFFISDESGLPVGGLANDLSRIPVPGIAGNEGEGTVAMAVDPDAPVEVRFTLDRPGAREVSLIGVFNNWDAEATPMKRKTDGSWSVIVALPRGTYQYKFLVDRTARVSDPSNPLSEPDGFGGENSVIEVR